MSDRPSGYIPGSDLPLTTPGALDYVVGVERATGAMRRFPLPQSGEPKDYAVLADLPAPSGLQEGTSAHVNNDPDPANNGRWAVFGGTWVKSADLTSALEGEIGRVETSLEAEIGQVDATLSAQIADVDATLSTQIADVDATLSTQIADVDATLSAQIADVDATLSTQIADVDATLSAQIVDVADTTSALQAQVVDVDATLSARMKLGRAKVTGDAAVVGKIGTRYLVKTREGSLYLEGSGGGTRSAAIAAVTTPVEISTNTGLIVDFDAGPTDGSGAYIPQVASLGSSSSVGWQSGEKYVLFGRDASGVPFGEYTINASISPFDGEIAVAASPNDGLPTWDQETRTLTWPQLVIAMRTGEGGDPAQTPRILLNAGSTVVPDSQVSVVYLDLSQVVQSGTPASAVIAVDYLAGPRMEPGGYLPLFCVGRSFAYPVRFPPTVGSASLPAPEPVVSSGELILTADTETLVHIHSPLVGQPGQFMRWTMERRDGTTTRDMPYDVWQVRSAGLATLSGGISALSETLIDNGQLEYAIRREGDSGFDIGGQAHGNDIMDNVLFLLDGAPITPAALVAESHWCRRFEVVQHSTVTDTDTTTHIADRVCRWVFEGADLILSNRLEFVGSLATRLHYGPMPSIVRLSGSTQITDRAMRSPDLNVADVSGTHSRVNSNSRQVQVWGESSGLSVDTEILEGWDANSQVHISSELSRNKVYFEVDGPAPSYAPGDATSYTARIRISHR